MLGFDNDQIDELPKVKLPEAIESEQAVLGAMLIDGTCIDSVYEILGSSSVFSQKHHSIIYDAIVEFSFHQQAIDYILLVDTLRQSGQLNLIGGTEYLISLIEAVPHPEHAKEYALAVHRMALRRHFVSQLHNISLAACDPSSDYLSSIDAAESALSHLKRHVSTDSFNAMDQLIDQVFISLSQHQENALLGLASGYMQLDETLNGFQKGHLITIAGPSTVGKTALLLNIATCIGNYDNTPVAFISPKLSKESLTFRLLVSGSQVDSQRVARNMVRSDELDQIQQAACELSAAPIFIDDSNPNNLAQLKTNTRKLAREHGIKILIIDDLEVLAYQNHLEIDYILKELKALAVELQVPVIVSRKVPLELMQKKKRLKPETWKSCGLDSPETDVVILIHRQDIFSRLQEDPELTNTADVMVIKNHGPTGICKLYFDTQSISFNNLAPGFDTH